eukprot:2314705-Pyramimonas_sp.AAC.1
MTVGEGGDRVKRQLIARPTGHRSAALAHRSPDKVALHPALLRRFQVATPRSTKTSAPAFL